MLFLKFIGLSILVIQKQNKGKAQNSLYLKLDFSFGESISVGGRILILLHSLGKTALISHNFYEIVLVDLW